MSNDANNERGSWVSKTMRFVTHDLWHIEVGNLSKVGAWTTQTSRILLITGRGFVRDSCPRQAAALTYLTIFTLPALLALAFSVAKGFQAFDYLKNGVIEDFLQSAFPSDGGEGSARIRELVDQIFDYVESADVGVLGTAGVVFLLYASVKMLSSVEGALNEIWGVKRSRSLVRKFSDYVAIVVVIPIVLLVGSAFTAALKSNEIKAMLAEYSLRPVATLLPLVAICGGMTLVLMTLPNTRVKIGPAIVGGIVSGLLWQLAQIGFVEFQLGLSRVGAMFSSFAAVPLLLSWIYLSWMTLFVGAELSFAIQNERVITSAARTGKTDQAFREALGPRLAGRVVRAFLRGETPPTAIALATELNVPPRTVSGILESLVTQRILAESELDQDDGYLPARDPDSITLLDVLHALRHEDGVGRVPTRLRLDERVDRVLRRFDEVLHDSADNLTLRELAASTEEELERADDRAPIEEVEPAGTAIGRTTG